MANSVLVTDAQMRSSLAVIRSLGEKKIEVTAGEDTYWCTGFFSKYSKKIIRYPSPKKEKELFQQAILSEIKHNSYDIIIPVADACLLPLLEIKDEISEYSQLCIPDKEIFMRAYDKSQTLAYADEIGVPTPDWHVIHSLSSLSEYSCDFRYPIIIKPCISSGSRGFHIINNYNELSDLLPPLLEKYGKMLIQEYIPNGSEFGIYTIMNFQSEICGLTLQKRIRSYPTKGGPSTLRETIPMEKYVPCIKKAEQLLKKIQWNGISMVEFRIDKRSGIPKLMEINPRFWGSLNLSILSGVNFPYLLYQLYTEGSINHKYTYIPGVRSRWLLPGELLWYGSSDNKVQNLKELFRFDVPDDIISLSDPGPTLGFCIASMRGIFNREMRKFVFRR